MQAAERPAFVPWMRGALEWGASQIIVTEMVEPEYMSSLIAETESRHIVLAFAPPRIRTHAYELTIERTGTLSLIRPRSLPICTPEGMLFRRALDLLIAIPTLIALAPLFIVIALAIRIDSPGPIIFRQIRVGRGGRPFEMLKFRSMPLDAETKTGPVWANYLAGDFTTQSLAATFDRALNDDALRARIRSNARRYAAARFDLRRTARAHADLYREIAAR